METPIHIFEPNTFKSSMTTLIFGLLTVSSLILLFYINKKDLSYQHKKRKGMYSMLVVIAMLLSFATTILNFWNSFQYDEVKIYNDYIELPTATVPFEDIRKAYIYVDRPQTIVSPPPDSLMNYDHSLFIEEYDKTKAMHILHEENYPIFEIIDKLTVQMKK